MLGSGESRLCEGKATPYCKGFAMKLVVVAALETSELRTFKITLVLQK